MEVSTVVAATAVVISLGSLAVSIYAAKDARHQSRLARKPILQLSAGWRAGQMAGVRLENVGNGPARIIDSELWWRDECLGPWDRAPLERIRSQMNPRPSAATFGADVVVEKDYDRHLLYVEPYDPEHHAAFVELIDRDLNLWISYASLDGERQPPAELRPGRRHRPPMR